MHTSSDLLRLEGQVTMDALMCSGYPTAAVQSAVARWLEAGMFEVSEDHIKFTELSWPLFEGCCQCKIEAESFSVAAVPCIHIRMV